jgi:cytochrome c oxidase subunit 3/cytochrome o ubiquinol oxidase subunit 3
LSQTQITTDPAVAVTAPRVLVPPPIAPETRLTGPQWGMITFLISEVAFFSTLIVAYLAYIGKDTSGPKPAQVFESLRLVIVNTFCLLASSGTVHVADGAIRAGRVSSFLGWWTATIVLGVAFLAGTAYEWYELIVHRHLTISTNLFGTTYYTLVGFHAAHVTVGMIMMLVFLGLALRGAVTAKHHGGVELVSWYWHFVDGVWVVVFTVVYVVGR